MSVAIVTNIRYGLYDMESFQRIWKVSGRSKKCPDHPENVAGLSLEHIWTMLMHKILQNHLLCAFVVNLKIDAIYALYPESFCNKNLAIRKVFAFCDSEYMMVLFGIWWYRVSIGLLCLYILTKYRFGWVSL